MLVLASISAACIQFAPTLLPRLTNRQNDDPIYQLAEGVSPAAARSTSSDSAAGASLTTVGTATSQSAGASTGTRQLGTARRGTIIEALPLLGRVAGQDEITVKFPNSGKVSAVSVAPGDSVQAGQVLIETGSESTQSQLDQAQAELETANIRLQQGRAQAETDAQSRQRDSLRQSQDAAAARRAAVADAEAGLHRAEADLAAAKAGPSAIDIRTGEAAVTAAHTASQKAEADLARLMGGPDPTALRTAQTALSQAQSVVDRSQTDLDRLTRGADPNDVRSAERDLQRAQNTLKFAQSVKLDPKASSKDQADHDQAIAQAQLDVQDAQDRLAKLKQPPDPATVNIARRSLLEATAAMSAAKDQLDALKAGPTEDVIDQASAVVDAAHIAEQNAQDRLDQVRAHPTPAELRTAQDKLTAAQAALSRVSSASDPGGAQASDPGAAYNLVLLEKEMARIQARIDGLQKDLANTRLTAPFAGTVTTVQVHTGDQLSPGTPVISLAKAGDPYIRVEVSEKDLGKLAVGQTATFDISGLSNPSMQGSLSDIITAPRAAGGSGQVAIFNINWPADKPAPAFGTSAQVQVAVKQSDNALLVPKKALHTAGQRQYVQVQQGSSRSIATVTVGIFGKDEVEILSGLSDGQVLVVGP